MNKLIIYFVLISFVSFPVLAQNNLGRGNNAVSPTQTQLRDQDQTQVQDQTGQNNTPTGSQDLNQNQTQNQGEDTQLQNRETEQEQESNSQENGMPLLVQTQTRKAKQVMAELNQSPTLSVTSIGQQVRALVQTQEQAQINQESQLEQVQIRSQVMKFFIGPDYKTINSLRNEIDQNQERIRELNRVQTQLDNESDQTLVTEMVQALTQETNQLQEKLDTEEQGFSLFGWLFRFFS